MSPPLKSALALKPLVKSVSLLVGALVTIAAFQNCTPSLNSAASPSGDSSSSAPAISRKSYPASDGQTYDWKAVSVGAGGWLTGIDISPDGATRVVRTDTYGAYIWDGALLRWRQLVNSASMPVADQSTYTGNSGVYEIRVAPSEPNRIYMMRNGYVYRSNDRGLAWVRTNLQQLTGEANADNRHWGQKMAVDPVNANVVYVGTDKEGLFVSVDGGSSFQPVNGIPVVNHSAAIAGLAFDPASGVSSGRTNVIYAGSYGNGVYRSTNGGASFSRVAGGPSSVKHGRVASDGDYYAVGDDGNSVYRLHGSVWSNITPPGSGDWQTIATDPFDPARIVIAHQGGQINMSLNQGSSWVGEFSGVSRRAADVPWLAWTNESYMSTGDMIFDPQVRNRLFFSQGIGVWYADLSPSASNSIVWNSQSAGIEQLVANQVISPPGGKPLLANWDRPVFRVDNPDVFPETHGPDRNYSISMGWSIDYAASNPSYIALLSNFSGGAENSSYSSDGGQTWTKFPSMPSAVVNGSIGGDIAAASPSNLMIVPSGADPYVTTDGGRSWKIPAGLPAYSSAQWHWAYYLKRQILVADRVNVGTFYLWSHQVGLYRSTDGGLNFSLMSNPDTHYSTWYNTTLAAVPGRAGHLFLTGGPSGNEKDQHPIASNALFHSTDGGASWKEIPDVAEALSVGFGKSKTVGGYPAIYFAGFYRKVFGVYRSDDEGAGWTKIADYPIDSLDLPLPISGDMNEYGKVYVGFSGSGWAYGQISNSTSATPTPSPVATPVATPAPTATPTPKPTPAPTPTPVATPTPAPTATPTPKPTPTPTPAPTATPTPTPAPTPQPTPVPGATIANGRYRLTMMNSGKFLGVVSASSNSKVVQNPRSSGTKQIFDIQRQADGTYRVKSVNSGLCWSIASGSPDSGAYLVMQTCRTANSGQSFTLEDMGSGGFRFKRKTVNMCLDLQYSSSNNNAPLWQYECYPTPNQQMVLSPAP